MPQAQQRFFFDFVITKKFIETNFNKLSEMLVNTTATYVFHQLFLAYIPKYIMKCFLHIPSIGGVSERTGWFFSNMNTIPSRL